MAKEGFNLWDAIFHPKKEEQEAPKYVVQKPTVKKKPEEPKKTEEQRKDEILAKAEEKMAKNLRTEYTQAIQLLQSISGWKNADELVIRCREAIAQKDKQEEVERAWQQKKDRKFQGRVKLVTVVLLAVAVAAGGFFVYRLVTAGSGYIDPLSLIERGEYDKADRVMQEKIDQAGTDVWQQETIYAMAEKYAQLGESQRAYNWYEKIKGYNDARAKAEIMLQRIKREKLQQIQVGSMIELGEFAINPMKWQPEEKAQWIILSKADNLALVVSRDILDVRAFCEEKGESNWKDSDLRSWLKEDFYANAFTDAEREVIVQMDVIPDANPLYDTENGGRTKAYVFLLGVTQVEMLLTLERNRKAEATAYAQEQGAENNNWLLRTMGKEGSYVTYVDSEGNINYEGLPVTQPCGIRPAMWVDLVKIYFP